MNEQQWTAIARETPSSAGIETDAKGTPKPSVKAYCEAGELIQACNEALAGYKYLLAELGLPPVGRADG